MENAFDNYSYESTQYSIDKNTVNDGDEKYPGEKVVKDDDIERRHEEDSNAQEYVDTEGNTSGKHEGKESNGKVNHDNEIHVNKAEEANNNVVYKSKITPDGRIIRVILSEGETSSGFDSISSIDSNNDFAPGDRSVYVKNVNVVVEIKNEIAFQNSWGEPIKSSKKAIESKQSVSEISNDDDKRRLEYSSSKYDKHEGHFIRKYRSHKDGEKTRRSKRDELRKSRERSYNKTSRSISPSERTLKRANISDRSTSRSYERKKSEYQEEDRRRSSSRRSRSKNKRRIRSISPDIRTSRSLRTRSSSYDRRTSTSSDKGSGLYYSKTRKRTERSSRYSRKYENTHFPRQNETRKHNCSERNSYQHCYKEKKIKIDSSALSDDDSLSHAKRINKTSDVIIVCESPEKSVEDHLQNNLEENQTEASLKVTEMSLPFETSVPDNIDNRSLPKLPEINAYNASEVSKYCSSLPTVGVDNMPLVPGPTGLPVHVLPTGELVPYDMDGRKIPIGPNGHYLPLDLSGRLFPHIVTSENTAVPVYISEDGILRLPNSQPVPFGTPHRLPVNIDGKMILIGPDSRPLMHYPDLPVHPPICINEVTDALPPSVTTLEIKKQDQQSNAESSKESDYESSKIVDIPKTEKTEDTNEGIEEIDLERDLVIDETRIEEDMSLDSDIVSDSNSIISDSETIINPLHNICSGSVLKQIIDSVDEDLLRRIYELTKEQNVKVVREEPKENVNPVVKRIQSVLQMLDERNYQPPVFGRFILSEVLFEPPETESEFESPLWRNRVKLPFITPDSEKVPANIENSSSQSTITYNFLSRENSNVNATKNDSTNNVGVETRKENFKKISTADFGVQCDFTTDTISEFNCTVSKLRTEIISWQNAYSNLLQMSQKHSSSTDTSKQNGNQNLNEGVDEKKS